MTTELSIRVAQFLAILGVLAYAAQAFLGLPAGLGNFLFDQATFLMVSALSSVAVTAAVQEATRSLPPSLASGFAAFVSVYATISGV